MNGAELVCRTLQRLGADCVFGLPGTQNVELFEGLRVSGLRVIVATHELAAGFMANGYARASGRPGVVVAIQGPGFTYAVTALAEARHDSAPLLLVTGAPESSRKFALQALDQAAVAGSLVKGVIRPDSPAGLVPAVERAFRLTREDEPGPVVLELPAEVTGVDVPAAPPPAIAPEPAGVPEQGFAAVLERLGAARKPVFLVGQGGQGGAEALRVLAERLEAPVATTLSGRGVIPEDHPMAFAVDPGVSGVAGVNRLLAAADLVLALGCKLSHNGSVGFQLNLPQDRLVHVDASGEVLNANYPASLAFVADVPDLLERLAREPVSRSAWGADELAVLRREAVGPPPVEPRVHGVTPGTPAAFFAALRAALPRDAILTLDSGQHQMLARRHYRVLAPWGLIAPSDYQSMGFGLPAAIGAAAAAPERRVVALIGDGGFAMSGLELLTAVRERIPLTVIVFNDGVLGLIRDQQHREFGRAHGTLLHAPDYAGLAAAVGAGYALVDGDAEATFRSALGAAEPVLVEVRLGDSARQVEARAKGLARAVTRRALGPRLLQALKRLLS